MDSLNTARRRGHNLAEEEPLSLGQGLHDAIADSFALSTQSTPVRSSTPYVALDSICHGIRLSTEEMMLYRQYGHLPRDKTSTHDLNGKEIPRDWFYVS